MYFENRIDSIIRVYRTKYVLPHIEFGTTICDIGCGANPFLLKTINDHITKGIGLDYLVTNSIYNEKIELKNADLSSIPLPIPDTTFDVVTMLAVLEHLNNPNAVIQECFRALKPKGKLILTTPSPASKPILETMAKLNFISRQGIADHKHYFSAKEITALLSKDGFTQIKIWHKALGLNTVAVAIKP